MSSDPALLLLLLICVESVAFCWVVVRASRSEAEWRQKYMRLHAALCAEGDPRVLCAYMETLFFLLEDEVSWLRSRSRSASAAQLRAETAHEYLLDMLREVPEEGLAAFVRAQLAEHDAARLPAAQDREFIRHAEAAAAGTEIPF